MDTRKIHRQLKATLERSATRLAELDLSGQADTLRQTAVDLLQKGRSELDTAIDSLRDESAEAKQARLVLNKTIEETDVAQQRIYNGLRGEYYTRAAQGEGEAEDYLRDLNIYLEGKNAAQFASLSLDEKVQSLESALSFVPKMLDGDLAGKLQQEGQQALDALKAARSKMDSESTQALEAGKVLEKAFAKSSELYLAGRDIAGAALRLAEKHDNLARFIPPLRSVFNHSSDNSSDAAAAASETAATGEAPAPADSGANTEPVGETPTGD